METEQNLVDHSTNGKNGHRAADTLATDAAQLARRYAEDDRFAQAFDAARQRILESKREELAALEKRMGGIPAAPKAKRQRQVHPAVTSGQTPGTAAQKALEAIRAAGKGGISSRKLGAKIGQTAGPIVKGLIAEKRVRQRGTAGSTKYFAVEN